MKTLLIISALFISQFSWASGTSIGNGGVGIMENNKLYMLDLFEQSVHDRPAFGNKPIVHWLPAKVDALFPKMQISASVKQLFTQKVSDVLRMDYYMGHAIVGGAEAMDWRLVNSSLVRLNDDGSPLDPSQFVQVAVRKGVVVFIDREKWNLLDDANKVALLIHEVLYAQSQQNSAVSARAVTGEYFTEQFLRSGYSRTTLAMNKNFELGKDNLTYTNLIFKKDSVLTYPLFGYFYAAAKTMSQTPGYFKVAIDGKKIAIVEVGFQEWVYKNETDYCKTNRGNNLHIVMAATTYEYMPMDFGVFIRSSDGVPLKESIDKSYPLSRDQKACEIDMKRAFQDYEMNVLNKEYVSYQ
jgi:hypothetical protein